MGLFLDLTISALAILTVGLYIWSARSHFRPGTPGANVSGVAAATFLSLFIYMFLLFAGEQPLPAQVIGITVILGSLALFGWAIVATRHAALTHMYDTTQPDSLLTTGPFAYVRHPFYTSYIVFWTGFALAAWSLWALLPWIAIVAIYARAARFEEAKFLGSPLAESYRDYTRRAGLFWPKWTAR
jgi:protein-S-isoprenylcysteine O-methyltransferase Ste14